MNEQYNNITALILVRKVEDRIEYTYLNHNSECKKRIIDLDEPYAVDPDIDINFPTTPGLYKVVIDLAIDEWDAVTTVKSAELVHNLKFGYSI